MAVKFGKENKQILWQLSHLKVQTRDYDGFAESRRLLMVKKLTNITNFDSIYLSGNYQTALEVFDSIEQVISEDDK